ncbi:hypothetical protein QA601_09305 [Chitinispirillales bacterium ANBcel5]|uniref:hypothetical protein n=1 Tax=Cellulosispirillum alkaliphilum TaxID=3039283 RepID=UPI002A520CCB|nr:hypothetical protein [Chitinispirillales bacterium ANBcel5]
MVVNVGALRLNVLGIKLLFPSLQLLFPVLLFSLSSVPLIDPYTAQTITFLGLLALWIVVWILYNRSTLKFATKVKITGCFIVIGELLYLLLNVASVVTIMLFNRFWVGSMVFYPIALVVLKKLVYDNREWYGAQE